jgi:hypothetical protein
LSFWERKYFTQLNEKYFPKIKIMMSKTIIFTGVFSLFIFSLLFSQNSFSGVFRESSNQMNYWNNMSWDDFVSKHRSLREKGYQLIDVEGRHVGRGKSGRFWGIWMKTNIPSRIIFRVGWNAFEDLVAEQAKQGYALDDIESILDRNGKRIYLGLFCKGKKVQRVRKSTSFNEVTLHELKYRNEGFYITDVDPFKTKDGNHQFLAIYTQSGASSTKLSLAETWKSFNEDRLNQRKAGKRLFDFERFKLGGKTYYFGLYRNMKSGNKNPKESFWSNLDWNSFKAYRQFLNRQRGMRLFDIEIHDGTGKTQAPEAYNGKQKDTPDIHQHLKKIEEFKMAGLKRKGVTPRDLDPDLEFGSNSFCGPTAVSNGIMYWAEAVGYKKLNPSRSQIEMVKVLGNKDHMDAFEGGTSFSKMAKSVRKYLADRGHQLKEVNIRYIGDPSGNMENLSYVKLKQEVKTVDLSLIKKGLIHPKSTMIIVWGRYKMDRGGNLNRTGGHYVTAVGYGMDENNKIRKNTLIVHNPATGPKKPQQEYLKLRPLTDINGINKSTKLKKGTDWQNTAEGKMLIKMNGGNFYVFEGFADFRIR